MEMYLRLLLIEIFLFIGLGFFCDRPEDIKQQPQDPPEIAHDQFQPGFLPVDSRATPAPSFLSNWPDRSGIFQSNPRHLEKLTY